MKSSDLFGVVVRVTGFLIIIYGLWNVWAGFENIFENLLQLNSGGDTDAPSILSYFAFGIPALLLGAPGAAPFPTDGPAAGRGAQR